MGTSYLFRHQTIPQLPSSRHDISAKSNENEFDQSMSSKIVSATSFRSMSSRTPTLSSASRSLFAFASSSAAFSSPMRRNDLLNTPGTAHRRLASTASTSAERQGYSASSSPSSLASWRAMGFLAPQPRLRREEAHRAPRSEGARGAGSAVPLPLRGGGGGRGEPSVRRPRGVQEVVPAHRRREGGGAGGEGEEAAAG